MNIFATTGRSRTADLQELRRTLADIADLHVCDPDGFCRADGSAYPCPTIKLVQRAHA